MSPYSCPPGARLLHLSAMLAVTVSLGLGGCTDDPSPGTPIGNPRFPTTPAPLTTIAPRAPVTPPPTPVESLNLTQARSALRVGQRTSPPQLNPSTALGPTALRPFSVSAGRVTLGPAAINAWLRRIGTGLGTSQLGGGPTSTYLYVEITEGETGTGNWYAVPELDGSGKLTLEGNDRDNFLGADNFDSANPIRVRIEGGGGNDAEEIDAASGGFLTGSTMVGGDGNDNCVGFGTVGFLFEGGAGRDTLSGAAGNDTIDGGADDDVLGGGDGNDSILGGDGNDNILGNIGNDTIDGGQGNDTGDGSAGTDSVVGGAGDDVLGGGDGNDTIAGGDGNDNILGNAGDDSITGGLGNDTADGAEGADSIAGGVGDDLLGGGDGNDTIVGEDGNDRLLGNDGNDSITGNNGTDVLFGGAGNDTLDGGADRDDLDGGPGTDVITSDSTDVVTDTTSVSGLADSTGGNF